MPVNHRTSAIFNLPGALCSILLLFSVSISVAQQSPAALPHHNWEVYLERDIDSTGLDRLLFVDMLTGDNRSLDVFGERYTPVNDHVIFYNPRTRFVMIARPDGTIAAHPFIQLGDSAERVDWVLADDARAIAWTMTFNTAAGLSTVTQIASPTGAEQRILLEDGPRKDGIRALPVAIVGNQLVMDTHPDGLSRFAPYTQYAGLFSVSLDNGDVALLPDEPGCFCGAAVRGNQFLRLALDSDLRGFDVHIKRINEDFSHTIPSIALTGFTQAGDLLIAPDGTHAVYALSQIENFGAINQSVRTVFVLVDLVNLTQEQLTEPITTYVHPVQWTEDNSAIIFTSPQRTGTWKISLNDAQLIRVAEASFLGTVSD